LIKTLSHPFPLLTILVLPPPYNLLIGNNDLLNNVLVLNIALLKDTKGVEAGDKGELT